MTRNSVTISKDVEMEEVELNNSHVHTDTLPLKDSVSEFSREISEPELPKRCCGVPFERYSGTWWNPKFDSGPLERQYQISTFPLRLRYFQMSLVYIIVSCFMFLIYYAVMQKPNYVLFIAGSAGFALMCTGLLVFTCTYLYAKWQFATSFLTVVFLFMLTLASFSFDANVHLVSDIILTPVSSFMIAMQIIMLLYTIIPLKLYLAFGCGVFYSIVFEVLNAVKETNITGSQVASKMLLHACIHVLGIHCYIHSTSRLRTMFLQNSNAVLMHRQLAKEKKLKDNMIHSVMPEMVAKELLKSEGEKKQENLKALPKKMRKKAMALKKSIPEDLIAVQQFRELNMYTLKNVSILYADIVGFTNMSSGKKADELVSLLNDLFGRFDRLGERVGCEKISTLGDCYYCVSGCPEPRPDHAKCCVKMGLGMCEIIQEFDRDKNETVNMRVGIHTGNVLCGIVGTTRFKFDVWSNDVSLANIMESSGLPGRVHVSQATVNFLDGEYEIEDGKGQSRSSSMLLSGVKTYLIVPKSAKVTGDPVTTPVSQNGAADSLNEKDVSIEMSPYDGELQPPMKGDADGSVSNISSIAEMFPRKISRNDNRLTRGYRDKELINIIEENPLTDMDYFFDAPVNVFTLNFSQNVEIGYRQQFGDNTGSIFLSVSVAAAVYLLMLAAIHFALDTNLALTLVSVFFTLIVAALTLLEAYCHYKGVTEGFVALLIYGWIPQHAIGFLFIAMPIILVYLTLRCDVIEIYFFYFFTIAIFHVVNFPQLCYWLKTAFAFVSFGSLLIVLHFPICDHYPIVTSTAVSSSQSLSTGANANEIGIGFFSGEHIAKYELILDFICVIVFLLFLNREFDLSYRVNFHGEIIDFREKETIEQMKKQANLLLSNIIPDHVTDELKRNKTYSKNHDDVGVIFVTITNFWDFYEESYQEGKECIRVLNEMLSDFDELLESGKKNGKYEGIDKIKSIGATYMAASGLNLTKRDPSHPYAHLVSLINFVMEMKHVLDAFNVNMLSFEFHMRAGMNHGPVTSGVIGTTKLYYDIWGDTVNVASRMDSTGEHKKIQVSDCTAKVLDPYFEFQHRGTIFVKGKGDLNTYFVGSKTTDPIECSESTA